jgi:purine-binding chemotaxis protein CheW
MHCAQQPEIPENLDMNAISKIQTASTKAGAAEQEYLSFVIAGQFFGIPVLKVQDVLLARALARIPLAPKEVAGALNLRGRIVTAIDMRSRLNVVGPAQESKRMSIVIEHEGELYSLIVDAVGDVLRLSEETFEANPATLNPGWKELSFGVHRLDGKLMLVLDVDRVLTFVHGSPLKV